MDKGRYLCDASDYNTGTWRNCNDGTITQYSRYPINVYDELLIDKKKTK